MALKERTRRLALVAELLNVHLPATLKQGDVELAKDLLRVVETTLREAFDDAEQSAKSLDERTQHAKAEQLRHEWTWARYATQYAHMLTKSDNPLGLPQVQRLTWLIPVDLDPPERNKITNLEKFRGSRRASRPRRKTARR
jgi:hypothetical protein